MNKNLVYVFNEDDMNTLLKKGYKLIQEDADKSIYIFENKKGTAEFSDVSKMLFTDVMRF